MTITTNYRADCTPGASFSVIAKPFAAAIDHLTRLLSDGGNRAGRIVPVLAAITIDATPGGNLILSCCDVDIEAVVIVPGDVDTPGAMVTNAATLRDIVKTAQGAARVMIRQTDTGKMQIDFGHSRKTLPTLPVQDVPRLRPAVTSPVQCDSAVLVRDLKRVDPFIVDNERRSGALLIESRADCLYLVAADGYNLAAATHAAPGGAPGVVDLPKRAAKALTRALKLWPGDHVSLAFTLHNPADSVTTIIGDHFAMTVRGGQGNGWGNWRQTIARVLGDQLQRSFDADCEPRLNPDALKQFTKAAGPVDVEIGDHAARLSIAGDGTWLGVTMLAAKGTAPAGYSYGNGGEAQARAYLVDLMARHGIEPVAGERRLVLENGRALGMTCGEFRTEPKTRRETVLDWDTLTEREIDVVEHDAGWQPGAFSVVMPQVREGIVADMMVEVDGKFTPIATSGAGKIHPTAAQVAKWCGPVDPLTHVAMPTLPAYRIWTKGNAPALAPEPLTGRAALSMTAKEMQDYVAACRRAAELANGSAIDPRPEPLSAAMPGDAGHDMPVSDLQGPDSSPVERDQADCAPAVQATIESPSLPSSAIAPNGAAMDELAALRAAVLAMAGRLDALERSSGFYPSDEATKMDRLVIAITPDDVDTAPATPERDRATRVKLVRTYLALRQARARSAEQAAQLAIGQAQYDALKGQLVSTEAALATAQTRLEQGRADARRFADVEQSLIDARTRGNRLLRVAMGQRTGLARVRLDLRGARAESGALRRQLAQAVAPTSPKSPPHGVMADALARAGF